MQSLVTNNRKIISAPNGTSKSDNYNDVVRLFEKMSPNYDLVTEEQINLANGRNTSLFPYKAQFSPDLINILIDAYGSEAETVFDPFVGCGTTLFEALKKGKSAFGTDINPAGIEMAKTSLFAKLDSQKRKQSIKAATSKVERWLGGKDEDELMLSLQNDIKKTRNEFTRSILSNLYLKLLQDKETKRAVNAEKHLEKYVEIVNSLPSTTRDIRVSLADARNTGLPSSSIDFVVTSPPYVNVFNYHQHNREFTDSLFNNALIVAKSEFGANRKHRQNRFLTVTQYSLDIYETFRELARVTKPDSRIIFVVGKESNVRGVSFRNDHIITAVAQLAGFSLIERQQRFFINRYGQKIYEAILHFQPNNQLEDIDSVRMFCADLLKHSIEKADKKEIVSDIKNAMDAVDKVHP